RSNPSLAQLRATPFRSKTPLPRMAGQLCNLLLMWRAIGKSVVGTSHLKGQLPCQDYSHYLRCQVGGECVLVVGVSDGAGSAALSHLGSQEAVGVLLRQVACCERTVADISREDVQAWFANALAH